MTLTTFGSASGGQSDFAGNVGIWVALWGDRKSTVIVWVLQLA